MIDITRTRYVVTRDYKGKTQIYCGLARNFNFKDIDNIGNTPIKTYLSEIKALNAYMRSWLRAKKEDVKIIKIEESVKENEND